VFVTFERREGCETVPGEQVDGIIEGGMLGGRHPCDAAWLRLEIVAPEFTHDSRCRCEVYIRWVRRAPIQHVS